VIGANSLPKGTRSNGSTESISGRNGRGQYLLPQAHATAHLHWRIYEHTVCLTSNKSYKPSQPERAGNSL